MDLSIENRTAVITGGSSGIGLATAKALAQEGTDLVLAGKSLNMLTKAAKYIEQFTVGNHRVIGIEADVTHNNEVEQLAARVKEEFGGAEILVHCAGIHGANGDFLSLSDEDWLQTIDVDLMGAVRICRAFIPQMLKNQWGRIVLIASENASQPYVGDDPYNACKAAIVNLTKGLSKVYSTSNIMINSVSPAFIATSMTDKMMEKLAAEHDSTLEEAVQWFLKNKRPGIVTNRRGKSEEVAAVIAFLCSEMASFVTGSNYRIDGGSVSSSLG